MVEPKRRANKGSTQKSNKTRSGLLEAIHVWSPTLPPQAPPPEDADAPKGVQYEERIVAFIDILGFKEIIGRSVDDPNLLLQIHSALDIKNDDLARHYASEMGIDRTPLEFSDRFHTFSDCIVMSVGTDPEELGLLIFMAFKICRQLLHSGFMSRGGIAMGKLLHRAPSGLDKSRHEHSPMVFGPAFNNAYTLEAHHADGARVILQNAVLKETQRYCAENGNSRLCQFFNTHIARAADGPAFIDLFADFPGSAFYAPSTDVTSNIREIHTGLCKALNESTDRPAQFRKNAMLANEFNRAVRAAAERRQDLHLDVHLIPRQALPVRD